MKEQLGTKVEAPLGQRLRVFAAVNRRTVAEVVSAALDSYLPPLTDLVPDLGSEPGRPDVMSAEPAEVS